MSLQDKAMVCNQAVTINDLIYVIDIDTELYGDKTATA